jgi:hypothetical protein
MCAFVVIGGASFAFIGENKMYTIVEKTAVGFGLGHLIAVSANTLRTMAFSKMVSGDYTVLIPVLVGLMFAFRFSGKYQFVSQYPASVILGVGIGLGVRSCVQTEILKQIGATISLPLANVNTIVVLVVMVSVFSMFTFTEKAGKFLAPLRTPGRCFVMLAFGSQMANMLVDSLNQLSNMAIKRLLEVFIRI